MNRYKISLCNFAGKHPYVVNTLIVVAILSFLVFPYLTDTSLPYNFNSDLSSALRSFYEHSYIWNEWKVIRSSWNIFYSIPQYGITVFEEFHYLFYAVFQGDIVYTYKAFIVFEIFACAVSMLVVSYKLTKRSIGSILAAIFYSLTPYFLAELGTHIYYLWGYVLLPPAIYLTYKALMAKSVKLAILAGGTIAFATILTFLQLIYLTGISIAVFALLITLFYADNKSMSAFAKSILPRLKLLVIMAMTFLALSACVIFPSLTFNVILAQTNVFEKFQQSSWLSNTFLQTFTLSDLHFSPLNPLMLFLPVFSALLLLLEKKKLYYILTIIGLLSVVLSVGPISPVFTFAFNYLPSFNAIRTPVRFTVTACFVFSLMAALAIDAILKKLKNKYSSYQKPIRYLFLRRSPIIASMIILVIFPTLYVYQGYNIAYGDKGPLVHAAPQTGLDYPESYTKILQFLNQADPQHQYRVIDMVSSNGQILSFDHKAFSGYGISFDLVLMAYRSPAFAKILASFGAKYIISLDDPSLYIGFGQIAYLDFNNALSYSPHFEKVYQFEDLVIYENLLTGPWIYPAQGALTVGGPQTLSLFYSLNLPQNWSLIYANQILDKIMNPQYLSYFDTVVFHGSDICDLAIMLMNNTIQPSAFIDPINPDNWKTVRTNAYPFDRPFFNVQNALNGQMAFSTFFANTESVNNITIPIEIDQARNYSVWVRALKSAGTGSVSISLDANQETTENFTGISGFDWIKTDSSYLEKGVHYLVVKNNDPTPLYLDIIAPISQKELDSQISQISSLFEECNFQTLYLREFARQFSAYGSYSVSNPWVPHAAADCLSMEQGATAKTNMYIDRAGNYTIGIRLLFPSGDLNLKVDGKNIFCTKIQQYYSGPSYSTWIITDAIALSEGNHVIELENLNAESILDFMYMKSTNNESNNFKGWEDSTLEDGFTAQPSWVANGASDYGVEDNQGITDFYVNNPNKSMKWSYNSTESININDHRFLVLRYKAINIFNSSDYALWFSANKTDGSLSSFYPIIQGQLIPDNNWHTLILDLKSDAVGADPSIEKITGLAFQVQANDSGNAHLYVDYLDFIQGWADTELINGFTARPDWTAEKSSDYGIVSQDGITDFYVNDANKSMKWEYNVNVDVNINEYSYLFLRYKVVNSSESNDFALWFDATDGNGNRFGFYPITQGQLIHDDNWHTLVMDLGNETNSSTTTITQFTFQTKANENGNAHLYVGYFDFSKPTSATLFAESDLGKVNFLQTELTEYEGNLTLNQRGFLVFLDSYYVNTWALQLENQTQYSLPAFYIYNAFPINASELQFKLSNSEPQLIVITTYISLITFAFVFLVACTICYQELRPKLSRVFLKRHNYPDYEN